MGIPAPYMLGGPPTHLPFLVDYFKKNSEFEIKTFYFGSKIVIQNFIPGLKEDWKVLIFGNKFYVINRKTRPNDFRASGSGIISYQHNLSDGFLDFAERTFKYFNVPNMAMDIAFDGNSFYLIEFQMIYFGSYTLDKSPFYFIKKENKWDIVNSTSILEEEYVESIIQFISNNN